MIDLDQVRRMRCVGDDVDLSVVVVVEDQVASLVTELNTTAVERDQHGLPGSQRRINRCHPAVFVHQPPVGRARQV